MILKPVVSEKTFPSSSTSSFTFSVCSSNDVVDETLPVAIREAHSEVEDEISRLNRLSTSVRKSGVDNRHSKAAWYVNRDDEGT
jgi:hypothetical protein